MTSPETIVENAWITVVSRIAMIVTPILVTVVSGVGVAYLDGRFSAQANDTAVVSRRVDDLSDLVDRAADGLTTVTARIIVLETSGARGRADRETFQANITSDLREMRATIVQLSNNVAALTATIEALKQRQALNAIPPRP